jgi:hypothetical protein
MRADAGFPVNLTRWSRKTADDAEKSTILIASNAPDSVIVRVTFARSGCSADILIAHS